MFVQEDIYESFIAKLVERAEKIKVGNPFDRTTTMGAQISSVQYEKILGYIEHGKNEGCELVTGGASTGTDGGYFIQPTIFKNVNETHKIFQEEIFGPVLSVTTFKDVEEVVHKANLTTYGLGAAVFTKDISKAHRIAASVRAGTVWVNGYHNYHEAAPFGGMKQSGIGREKGEESLSAYTETKTVMIHLG